MEHITKEIIALLRTVAAESLSSRHLIGGFMHSLDDSGSKGLGDIADPKADDVGLGMGDLKGIDLLGNICEQIVVLQVEEMNVY